jgi:serine hydrolase
MRISDFDILVIPGWLGSEPDHWQSRWVRDIDTAKFIDEESWTAPDKDEWAESIIKAVAATSRPTVFVAHSVGVIAVAHAAGGLSKDAVAGAFLVSAADVENAHSWPVTQGYSWPDEGFGFRPIPQSPLPFPAVLVSSSDDPYCRQSRARQFATAWGCDFADVGPKGHITAASGFGPWPDGLVRFNDFLAQLSP